MNITVYLGANAGNDPALAQATAELGRWIGESGNTLVYGGSESGLMGVLAKSVLGAGGKAIGVEPQFFIDEGYEFDGLTELIVTRDMSERKAKMIELGEAFIALPGGTGTLEEITEVMSKVSLRHLSAPCILYDLNGYYEPLRALLRGMIDAGCRPKSASAGYISPPIWMRSGRSSGGKAQGSGLYWYVNEEPPSRGHRPQLGGSVLCGGVRVRCIVFCAAWRSASSKPRHFCSPCHRQLPETPSGAPGSGVCRIFFVSGSPARWSCPVGTGGCLVLSLFFFDMLFPPEFVFFFGWGAPARGAGAKGRGNISTMREPPYRMQKLPSEDSFRRQFFLLSQIYARSVEGWLPGRRRVRGEAQLYLLGGGLILRQRRQLVQAEIAGGQRLAVRAELPAQ